MRIVIGSDHAAVAEKKALVDHLRQEGHEVRDLGTDGPGSVDYPDFAAKVARAVASGEAERGVLLCGTGVGMAMAANKVHGVRAAALTEEFTAEMCRRHNDANVACFGARVLSVHAMARLLDKFLASPFDQGRHTGRVKKIMDLEGRAPAPR